MFHRGGCFIDYQNLPQMFLSIANNEFTSLFDSLVSTMVGFIYQDNLI